VHTRVFKAIKFLKKVLGILNGTMLLGVKGAGAVPAAGQEALNIP
jgi:phage gp36-like protein